MALAVSSLKAVSAPANVQKELLTKVSALLESASNKVAELETLTKKAQEIHEAKARAVSFRDKVVPAMNALRVDIDALETLSPADLWPVPTYAEMLFKL